MPDVELIRSMRESDIPGIEEIEALCFVRPWSEASIRHDLTENVVARWLVMTDKTGLVLAYAGMWLVIDEGHVCNIAVRPGYQGRGRGRRITNALIKLAHDEGMRLMTLEVRRSNTAAQHLYHDLGFADVGYRRRYYEDNDEDALIMFLTISRDGEMDNAVSEISCR